MSRKRSHLLFLFFVCLLTIGLASNRTDFAAAQSSSIVISQVYGGGGNSGAFYTHDFIELFNRGTTAVDIDGWSVQYASAAGSSWQVTNLSGTIEPGQYYLIQQAAGAGGIEPLPDPDAVGSIPMSATNGKVALVSNTTALSGTCPTAGVVDFVGFGGNANCFEGSGPTQTLSNTTAALRLEAGCQDTDDNAADFEVDAPTPRNTASPINLCDEDEPESLIVISQVYGGGGNSGAFYTHDFIELFNRGTTAVDIDGWSVQYASAAGSSWQVTNLSGTIEPGQYYLIQQAAGAGGIEPLPDPDAVGSIPMSATNGKVALVSNTTALSGTCPTAGVVDFVGFGGNANCFEGSGPTQTLSNTTAALRLDNGCQDTDDNAADFVVINPPIPRNTASPFNLCLPPEGDILAVSKSGPASAPAGESISYELVISNVASHTAAESVVITDTLPADFSFVGFNSSGPVTLVNGDAPDIVWAVDTLAAGEGLTITLDVQVSNTFAATAVNAVVVSTATPEDVLNNNNDTAVTNPAPGACGDPIVPIYDIQGSGMATPLEGKIVNTEGVVIGDYEGPQPNLRGFYIQDPIGDGDPETSDGIFIFNFDNNNVNLGDLVRVSGMAGEFQDQTQISGMLTISVCDTGQTIEPTEVYLPFLSEDYLERYEGMLVRLPQMLYVTEHFQLGRFGQIVMSSGDRLYQPTHLAAPGDDALAIQAENDLNRIIIDDELNNQNPDPIFFGRGGNQLTASNTLRGGDTAENIVGVMTFTWAGNAASGNAYRVRPINALGGGVPNFQPANPRPAEPADVGGTLKVAAFNLLNYFNTFSGCTGGVGGAPMDCRGADNLTEFNRQWPKTVEAILGMDVDVLGVIEIENDGYGPDSAIQDLVNRLNDATAPGTFAFIDADAETGEINALGTDAIKVGLLYRPANVSPVGQTAVLNTEAFVNGGDADPRNRATIAQAFEQNTTGARFIVNVHHLKSKGSACEDPDLGDGQGNCAVVRTNAVLELMDWLYTDPTGTGETDILIIGDLNSYAQEDPIQAILEFGYVNLVEELLGPQAYSYVFDGQWGYLDYALASPTLFAQVTGVTEWNINADEPNVLDYNTNFKSANHVEILYAPDQFRSSDHDPILIGLHLHYIFSGFFPPVENPPEFNVVRAGSSIPIKFSLNGDMGLDILAPGSPSSHEIACTSGSGDGSEPGDYASSTSSLTYDPVADQYIYVWQTDSAWANTCRQFTLGLDDGTEHILYFRFR
jgi:uncharacterized protein